MDTAPHWIAAVLWSAWALPLQAAHAQSGVSTEDPEITANGEEPSTHEPQEVEKTEPSPFTIGGYAEAFYSWNFNQPGNGVTNYRGFDNRHNTFSISNVSLDARWDYENVVGRVALQVGLTPSTYYAAEPPLPGGAASSGSDLWKYIQEAYAGYRFDIGRPLTVTAGLFLSPIGPESMAVRDNWNWSRSNLFYGLPYYHTGLRVSYAPTSAWVVTLAGYNGWNSVVDNNDEKSISAQATYTTPELAVSFLYFTGVERPRDAPEGRAWRHVFDAYATWNVTDRFSLLAHADTGFEPNTFGTSAWVAGAMYGRLQILPELFAALRVDAFYEHAASNGSGAANAIFWPVSWVSSGTATLDYRPHDHVSFRLEYRHDQAAGPMYFGGAVMGDGSTIPFVANRSAQDTLTAGATAWF